MGRIAYILLIVIVLAAIKSSAQSFVSVQSGDWSQASTWNQNSVPSASDDVIVTGETTVTLGSNVTINRVEIESGATLTTNAQIRVNGPYIINGLHNGTGRVRLQGSSDSIAGNGVISTTTVFRVDNQRTIMPGSVIQRTSSNFRCPNNDTLFNSGTLILDRNLSGNSTTTFVNNGTGSITIGRALLANGTLVCSTPGNQVTYNRTGTGNQVIRTPEDGYYDLNISGNQTNSIKSMESGFQVLNDLTINGSTFTQVDTFTLRIGGDFNYITGTYSQVNGRLVMNGNSLQVVSGDLDLNHLCINNGGGGVSIASDTLKISGILEMDDGTLTTNGRLLITSNASGDASIGEIAAGANIAGDVTVQRYIDAGSTNWRFMGSPTTNATFEQWKDDFIMSGFPGSHHPNYYFASIYGYDETATGGQDNGFYTISIDDEITPGVGFWVFCGDNLSGTQPFMIDVTGPINQGDINLNTSYSISGGFNEDGWSLVANPYPSAIDWDDATWTKSNLDDAIYIWNTDLDQYASYVAGVGTNGGSNIIPTGQAFYVKATLPLPVLTAKESVKYDTTVTFLRERPQDDLVMYLTLAQNNQAHEAAIRVNRYKHGAHDGQLEAIHFPGFGANATELFSIGKDHDFSIQAKPVIESDTFTFQGTAKRGVATVHIEQLQHLDDFCVALIHPESGRLVPLNDLDSFQLKIEEDNQPVFFKIVITRMSTALSVCDDRTIMQEEQTEQSTEIVGIADLENSNAPWYDGSTREIVMPANLLGADYKVYDMNGSLVQLGFVSSKRTEITGVSAGVYFFTTSETKLKFVIE